MTHAKTILYAEDDPVVLTAYQMRLERAGYNVVVARDGLEAIRMLATLVPDLVLLDLTLPKFFGEEVLQFIQTNPALQSVPTVILSTNTIRDIAHERLLERACRRLIKSQCTTAMLLNTIESVLEQVPAASENSRQGSDGRTAAT